MIFPIHLAEALHRISFISFRHQTAEMSYGKFFPYFLNVIRMKILAGIIIPEALIGKVSLGDFLHISGDTYGADSAFLNINPVYSEEKVIQDVYKRQKEDFIMTKNENKNKNKETINRTNYFGGNHFEYYRIWIYTRW